MAIQAGDDFVVQKLLDSGASINAIGKTDVFLRVCTCILPITAAIEKRNVPLVERLIASGAVVNNPLGANFLTPLVAAVINPQLGVVSSLLQSGANPYDSLALDYSMKDLSQLQLLLEAFGNHPIPLEFESVMNEALRQALKAQDECILIAPTLLDALLVKIKNSNPNNILFSGVLWKALQLDNTLKYPILCLVLERGANPNTIFKATWGNDGTYLCTALCSAIVLESQGKVQILLKAGANPDANLASTCTSPMQLAVHYGMYMIVQILLESEANPSAVALLPWEGSRQGPKHLELGTPLQVAVERQDTKITTLLLHYRADTNSTFGKMAHTCLQMASRDGSKELVELLIEHGANVNAPPAKEFGATALQFAAIKGLLGIAYILLQYDADVNAAAAEVGGRTALEGAAEHGRIDMVQLLLNSGANVFQGGEEQYANSLRRASENGHQAVRRLLESYHG